MSTLNAFKKYLLTYATLSTYAFAGPTPIIYEQDKRAPLTNITLMFHCGSGTAPYHQEKTGALSIAFEALFTGTQTKSKKQWSEAMQGLGANAASSVETLSSYINMSVVSENFANAFDLLEETILQPAFHPKEIEILKKNNLGTLKNALSESDILQSRALRKLLYAGTSFEVGTAGTMSDTKKITPSDLKNILNGRCLNQNMSILLTSDKPLKELEPRLSKFYSKLSPSPKQNPYENLPSPKFSDVTLVLIPLDGAKQANFTMAMPGISANNPLRHALDVGHFVFSGSGESMLFDELRAKHGWVYGAYASYGYFEAPNFRPEAYVVYGDPQIANLSDTIKRALEVTRDYFSNEISKENFDIATNYLKKSYPFEIESADNRVHKKLNSKLFGIPNDSLSEYETKINALSPKLVREAVQKTHSLSQVVIVATADSKTLNKLEKDLKTSIVNIKKVHRFKPKELLE